jgi:uncharacterized protein YacL
MVLTLVRLGVTLAFALVGAVAGAALADSMLAGAVAGLGVGLLGLGIEIAAARVPLDRLAWGTAGSLAGLLGGLGVGTALAWVTGGSGAVVGAAVALLGAWVGGAVGARRAHELPGLAAGAAPAAERVLDTSVIIDGRIADIVDAGFLDGVLIVPQFVVRELQRLADSGDAVRRNRGRRGFEVLDRLRQHPAVRLTLLDADIAAVAEVDAKLIALARERGARLLTNDTALGRAAGLAGVAVGNLHELAVALRPVALPGETMQVQVLREGKETGQGVAYLEDGTMVVIEGGKRFLGQPLDVVVTSALQTAAGRMIFTRPRENDRDG